LCRSCHFVIGHLNSFESYNRDVIQDAAQHLTKVNSRPKPEKQAHKQRPAPPAPVLSLLRFDRNYGRQQSIGRSRRTLHPTVCNSTPRPPIMLPSSVAERSSLRTCAGSARRPTVIDRPQGCGREPPAWKPLRRAPSADRARIFNEPHLPHVSPPKPNPTNSSQPHHGRGAFATSSPPSSPGFPACS
jgi:hypothetical protein